MIVLDHKHEDSLVCSKCRFLVSRHPEKCKQFSCIICGSTNINWYKAGKVGHFKFEDGSHNYFCNWCKWTSDPYDEFWRMVKQYGHLKFDGLRLYYYTPVILDYYIKEDHDLEN